MSHRSSSTRALASLCRRYSDRWASVRSTAIPCRPLWIFLVTSKKRKSPAITRHSAAMPRSRSRGTKRREQLGHAAAGRRRAQLEHPQTPERASEFAYLGHDLIADEASVVLERLPLQAHPPRTGGRRPAAWNPARTSSAAATAPRHRARHRRTPSRRRVPAGATHRTVASCARARHGVRRGGHGERAVVRGTSGTSRV